MSQPDEEPSECVQRSPQINDVWCQKARDFHQTLQVSAFPRIDVCDGSPPRSICAGVVDFLRPDLNHKRVSLWGRIVHQTCLRNRHKEAKPPSMHWVSTPKSSATGIDNRIVGDHFGTRSSRVSSGVLYFSPHSCDSGHPSRLSYRRRLHETGDCDVLPLLRELARGYSRVQSTDPQSRSDELPPTRSAYHALCRGPRMLSIQLTGRAHPFLGV